jgi:2-dehydro-3-deoxyphosphooctonate aldolase (KDO 8-P synthase)
MLKVWILGPCGIDNQDTYFEIGGRLYNEPQLQHVEWYYKASFDKANRTSLSGQRGVGFHEDKKCFEQIKRMLPNIKLTTDVHEPWQAETLAGLIDVIQIPAFLCRQTDLVTEAARASSIVNVKKGQWLGPNNLVESLDKIKHVNPECDAWITDRGSNFGYDKLIVDFDIVDELKTCYDKVILDCTHSTQRSRKVHGVQANLALAKRYFLAASIFEYDGVFAETHTNPSESVSDKDSQIPMNELPELLNKQRYIWQGYATT